MGATGCLSHKGAPQNVACSRKMEDPAAKSGQSAVSSWGNPGLFSEPGWQDQSGSPSFKTGADPAGRQQQPPTSGICQNGLLESVGLQGSLLLWLPVSVTPPSVGAPTCPVPCQPWDTASQRDTAAGPDARASLAWHSPLQPLPGLCPRPGGAVECRRVNVQRGPACGWHH